LTEKDRLPTQIYNYIEYELHHYKDNKDTLELEKERILYQSCPPSDGQPRGNMTGNETERKAIALVESTTVISLESRIRAIDRAVNSLTDTHKELFEEIYTRKRYGMYRICDELGLSERSYKRYKREIIYSTAREMGVWPKVGLI